MGASHVRMSWPEAAQSAQLVTDAAQALTIADRDGVPNPVLFFDVDGLDTVNDTYGHDAGDDVLRRPYGRARRGGCATAT